MLDYILYQVHKPSVLLENELDHIRDYVELEKMRFHDTLKVDFDVNVVEKGVQIAPMILIPFVENAFKHGSIIDGYLSIKIKAKKDKENFCFYISNSCLNDENGLSGIGLDNIRKRLEMLYPEAYTLEINKEKHNFEVQLLIELKGLKNRIDAES